MRRQPPSRSLTLTPPVATSTLVAPPAIVGVVSVVAVASEPGPAGLRRRVDKVSRRPSWAR